MLNDDQISNWLNIASYSVSDNSIQEMEFSVIKSPRLMLKTLIIHLFSQIERFDFIITDVIYNSCIQKCISFALDKEIDNSQNNILWGAEIYTSSVVPDNYILCVAGDSFDWCESEYYDSIYYNQNCDISRVCALGIADVNKLERLLKIKAFW